MKLIKNLKFTYYNFQYSQLSAMAFRNKGRPIIGPILRLIPAMGGKVSPMIVQNIKVFWSRIMKIHATQGLPGVVKFLKVASVHIQQSIAGQTGSTLNPRIATTRGGLPKVLPVPLRILIRKGQSFYIRLSLTLCSLYRDFIYDSPVKVKTITDPYSGSKRSLKDLEADVKAFAKCFVHRNYPKKTIQETLLKKFKTFYIGKSSPQSFGLVSTNPLTVVYSALALTPELVKDLFLLSRPLMGFGTADPSSWIDWIRASPGANKLPPRKHKFVGKLGLKQEAAGKMRVFAMVDPWTQWVCKPYHSALFRILRRHRMDGTFDQLRPLDYVPWGKSIFSMDLSSATDRLPLSIQIKLFQEIFDLTPATARAWGSLLTNRDYLIPATNESVRYSVGQPMGALSSWAMLAMTHHFIVHVAAWRAHTVPYGKLFRGYAVLGDDIVIFDVKTSKQYHKIMSSIGVECNLNKSVLSIDGTGLEFAKKTFYKGQNVSATPLKELHSALQSPGALLTYGKKYNLTFPTLLKVAGFGYKVIGSYQKPILSQNLKVKFLHLTSMLQNHEPLSVVVSLFPHLSDKYIGAVMKLYFQQEYDKYSRRWNSLYKGLISGLYGIDPDLKNLKLKVINRMYDYIYYQYQFQLQIQLSEAISKLHETFRGMRFIKLNKEGIVDYFSVLFKINKELNKVSVDLLLMRHEKSDRPQSIKAFVLQQSLLQVIKPLVPLLKGTSSLPKSDMVSSSHSTNVGRDLHEGPYLQGSLLPLRLPTLGSIIRVIYRTNTPRIIVKLFLLRRLYWTAGFTSLLGVLSLYSGVKPVLAAVVSIWAIIQGLLILGPDDPLNPVFKIVGNIFLHSCELYLAGFILSLGYNWSSFQLFLMTNYEVFQEGTISTLQFLINPFLYGNALLGDSIELLLDNRQLINSWIAPTPGVSFYNFSFGIILFWVIKWFFFGLF
jgi:hypothetical protein